MINTIKQVSYDHFEFKNGEFKFYYSWDDKHNFTHKVIYPILSQKKLADNWKVFAFNVGLARFPLYFTPVNPDKIIIRAAKLNNTNLNLWHKWYLNGLGEYFYKNNLPLKINLANTAKIKLNPSKSKHSDKSLLLNGGGKDSAVAGEIMNLLNKKFTWFVLNPNKARVQTMKASGVSKSITTKGVSDSSRKTITKKYGIYYTGHQPLSLYLASLASLAAHITKSDKVIVSNEKSANVGNVNYKGKIINHQYTKTFEFEKDFNLYAKSTLNENLNYFSILRPFYELQIVKIFTKFPKYHDKFISCNQGVAKGYWCLKCQKCAFIYLSLYPFISNKKLLKIFGKDLLNEKSSLNDYLKLTGVKDFKPFECVGTIEESMAAMYLASKKKIWEKPYVVTYFENNIPELANGKKYAKEILYNYDHNNLVPNSWNMKLKDLIKQLLV